MALIKDGQRCEQRLAGCGQFVNLVWWNAYGSNWTCDDGSNSLAQNWCLHWYNNWWFSCTKPLHCFVLHCPDVASTKWWEGKKKHTSLEMEWVGIWPFEMTKCCCLPKGIAICFFLKHILRLDNKIMCWTSGNSKFWFLMPSFYLAKTSLFVRPWCMICVNKTILH